MRIIDLHAHIVPGVDDGSVSLQMSLEMIESAYEQGVRDIFCTSHSMRTEGETARYKSRFMTLQVMAKSRFPDLKLHTGCELLCDGEFVDDILYKLKTGVFLPLGKSKYVLAELYPDAKPREAFKIVRALVLDGWVPVIAHAERYPYLFDGDTLPGLIKEGAVIQVNLYSLEEESDEDIKQRARFLTDSRLAHFVGSDAHRTDRRAPKYTRGVKYITEHCEKEYAQKLLSANAVNLIF